MQHGRVGLLIVIASAGMVGLVASWPDNEKASPPAALQPVSSAFLTPVGVNAIASPPRAEAVQPTIAAAQQTSPSSTATRAEIFDSDDIAATALQIRGRGTPDEHPYAADALSSCHLSIESVGIPEAVRLQLASIRDASRSQDTPAVRMLRDQAEIDIRQQCSGFVDMTNRQRLELIQALRSGAGPIPGQPVSARQTLADLDTRLRNEDTRWSTVEADWVSASLHGDHAVLRRDAFGLLHGSIDIKASSGKARREALLLAVGTEMTSPFLSTFESREACANAGVCGPRSPVFQPDQTPEISAEVLRLGALYRNAFERRLPYQKIMSIR